MRVGQSMNRKKIVTEFLGDQEGGGKRTIKGFGQKTKWWWSSGDLRGRQRVKQLCAEKGGNNRDSEDTELLISLPINVAF